jgi:hypothetical protein
MRPPTITAVSVGASSRANDSATTRPVYSMPPNLRSPKANCTAITIPMKTLVTVTMPTEATPRASSCAMIARPSNGRFSPARSVFTNISDKRPRCSKNPTALDDQRFISFGGGGGTRLVRLPRLSGPSLASGELMVTRHTSVEKPSTKRSNSAIRRSLSRIGPIHMKS